MSYFFYKKLIINCLLLCFCQNIFAQIINIEERRIRAKDDSTKWYGHINTGFSMQQVKETVLNFSGDAQIEYKNKNYLLLSITSYNLIKAGQKDLINAAFEHIRFNYKLADKLTYEFFGQLQNNQLQNMKLRVLGGTGLRWKIFKSTNKQSKVYVGTAFLMEKNNFKSGEEKYFTRISNYISMTYRPSKNVLLQNTSYFQPAIDQKNALRWSSETDLELKITSKLSFKTAFNISKDGTLQTGIRQQTFNFSNGLKIIL